MADNNHHNTTVKLSKADVKQPDAIQAELRKGFKWTTQHSKIVLGSLAAMILLGGAISGKNYLDQKAETEVQSQYFKIEKAMNEKRADFAEAEMPLPKIDKNAKNAPKIPPAPTKAKATGDLAQDYGTIPNDLIKIIDQAPSSKAAKMAALNLAELQLRYSKYDEAKTTLSKVKLSNDVMSGLVLTQLGTVMANQNDCPGALSTWQKVLTNSNAKSLHGAVKLKQGLCYEATNDLTNAEKTYTQVKDEEKESPTGKAAEKYLRQLQTKKN